MLSLCWDIKELGYLMEELRKIRPTLNYLIGAIKCPGFSFVEHNIPRQLSDIRERLIKIVKGVFRYRRSMATHMFIVMISSESRNRKPYALPIQCLPLCRLKGTGYQTNYFKCCM